MDVESSQDNKFIAGKRKKQTLKIYRVDREAVLSDFKLLQALKGSTGPSALFQESQREDDDLDYEGVLKYEKKIIGREREEIELLEEVRSESEYDSVPQFAK